MVTAKGITVMAISMGTGTVMVVGMVMEISMVRVMCFLTNDDAAKLITGR